MATTIQISEKLQSELMEHKISDSETYEEVIWDLIEDTMEISKETKRELEKSRKEIKSGKYYTLGQIKQEIED
jgi:hypothetical protein